MLQGDDDVMLPLNVTRDESTLQLGPVVGNRRHVITRTLNGHVKNGLAIVQAFKGLLAWKTCGY